MTNFKTLQEDAGGEARPSRPSLYLLAPLIHHRALLVLALLIACASPSPAREWKDASGRTFEADLLGVERGKVIVRASKKRFLLPVELLSAADHEFIKSWAVGKTPGQLLPPPWWPDMVQQPEIHVKGGPEADGSFKFHSAHYEFNCDAQVSVSVMNDFAMVAEGTIRFLYALPVTYPPLEDKTFQARILSSEANYAKAGGPPGSSGVFISSGLTGEGVLLVPFESLGIERFLGRNTKGYDYNATVLIHEITHQITGELLPLMPRWISEGIAEYAATMPYRNGVFQLGERERLLALRQRLESYQLLSRERGLNAGSSWILKPSQVVSVPDEAWMTSNPGPQAQLMVHKLYLSSMFLMHYFLHYADHGDARRIRLYFHALNNAALYIKSRGEQGGVPDSLASRKRVTIDEIRSFFLRQLFTPEELAALDVEFRDKFTELGFRL